jgi:hypothetical protein
MLVQDRNKETAPSWRRQKISWKPPSVISSYLFLPFPTRLSLFILVSLPSQLRFLLLDLHNEIPSLFFKRRSFEHTGAESVKYAKCTFSHGNGVRIIYIVTHKILSLYRKFKKVGLNLPSLQGPKAKKNIYCERISANEVLISYQPLRFSLLQLQNKLQMSVRMS